MLSLDVVALSSFKNELQTLSSEGMLFTRNNSYNVFRLLCFSFSNLRKCIHYLNIKSGFRHSSLYPFDLQRLFCLFRLKDNFNGIGVAAVEELPKYMHIRWKAVKKSSIAADAEIQVCGFIDTSQWQFMTTLAVIDLD